MEKKKLTSKELMLISTELIRNFLNQFNVPNEIRAKLVRGISFGYKKDRNAIVELYMPGETPSDAIILVTYCINKFSGEYQEEILQKNLQLLSSISM
ncbi:MAG: hypothetical protein ACOVO2_24035 [Emticicia sp.]|uniref:hypothetical protein n=1 Tax=Emticicia sp. TaxID=1930953 RepID=UPI003BA57433